MHRATKNIAFMLFAFLVLEPTAAFANPGVEGYLAQIRLKESGSLEGNYGVVNEWSNNSTATGAYQFLSGTLEGLGVLTRTENYKHHNGPGEWQGVIWHDNQWGVKSRQDFLNSPAMQDAMMAEFTSRNYQALNQTSLSYVGQNVNGFVMDEAALLGAAHVLGPGGVNQWASCGFQAHCLSATQAAANGMTQQEFANYMMEQRMGPVAGMDISEMTNGTFTPGGGQFDPQNHLVADPAPPFVSLPQRASRFPEIPPHQGTMIAL